METEFVTAGSVRKSFCRTEGLDAKADNVSGETLASDYDRQRRLSALLSNRRMLSFETAPHPADILQKGLSIHTAAGIRRLPIPDRNLFPRL